ncbi:hypothetical protein GCK72_014617 [Caenorhabditis remanei]|uniref:Uncharacterized protein n=1 Tax=Caenorhabditis remanei TaxID=31234 RepID=A0A6A5GUF9_CAERE|nr:hypothetical protein GCK72_014617 [Caenorhabditis remanei]KAF1758159.1 hypothetical protein GCK72_014617 [Caenorhabditis remanei]
MVALMRVSSSSSPRMARWRCLGVIRFTLRSLEAFPASSRTSAVRYSRIAALKEDLEDFVNTVSGLPVNCGCGSNTSTGSGSLLQETMNTSDWELESSSSAPRDDLRLGLSGVLSSLSFSSGHC